MEYDWDVARENMKKIRLEHNMTMLQLALELGWSQSTIGIYEIGNRAPTILYVIAFCQYFGVKIEELFQKGDL